MRRELPFLSPISIALTIAVLVGVGISLWLAGGLGFNPGPVTASTGSGAMLDGFGSHAEFEQECSRCHQPLVTDQTDLCTRCHENVAVQRRDLSGTHGRIEGAIPCRQCHPEHKGRDYDSVAYAVTHFDHALTALPLTGEHAALDCETCHKNGDYRLTYAGCGDCHAEPLVHSGLFEESCDTCHTDVGWLPAVIEGREFVHDETGFSLIHHANLPGGQVIRCNDCHIAGIDSADPRACTACHADLDAPFMEEHRRVMGEDCLQCHDGRDRMAGFDHAAVFPLDGKHQALACADCHAGFQFAGTQADCVACHAEPEIHAGFFGTQCQRCHSTQAWVPAQLTEHTFPLNHGESGELECRACHPASYAAYTCYECHEHQPAEIAQEHEEEGISLAELEQCAECHPDGQEE